VRIKLLFLHSYRDRFPKNLGDVNDEQRERLHQNIREMEYNIKDGTLLCYLITAVTLGVVFLTLLLE